MQLSPCLTVIVCIICERIYPILVAVAVGGSYHGKIRKVNQSSVRIRCLVLVCGLVACGNLIRCLYGVRTCSNEFRMYRGCTSFDESCQCQLL